MDTNITSKIKNGKVQTKRLEINVTHHCNLFCKGCSHLSPLLPRFFISPDQLYKELSLLSKYCEPELISLVGGEPLLHPDFLNVVKAVRSSGISKRIRVVTNGILLHKMTDQFWKGVDEVHVSCYTSHLIKANDLVSFQKIARNYKTIIVLRYQDYFRESFSVLGTSDNQLINKIYFTCKMPHESCCHTLYQGHYYKCPQAVFIPLVYGDHFDFSNVQDSIKVADHDSPAEELAKYLCSCDPLMACRYCLGSVGKLFTQAQEKRRGSFKPIPTEELIDWKHLEKLERKGGFSLPVWLWEPLQKTKRLVETLPPSIRLSPTFRRGITILKKTARQLLN